MGRWSRATVQIVKLFARPVRLAWGPGTGESGGIVVQPYRGYGDRRRIFMIGRVFHQSGRGRLRTGLGRQLQDVGRRLSRRAVGGALLTARFGDDETCVATDPDGYFRIHLDLTQPPPDDRLWHWIDLTLQEPEVAEARGRIFIPPRRARYVVISDIDDTIVYTGVANKLGMLWRLFVEGADSRVAFPGAAALYRAFHNGAEGDACNPILYVSRGPWGIYDVLDEFFRRHAIPIGPILFLREWGISLTSPLPRKAVDHKRRLIDAMLEFYRDRPFVLIGDSGQHDPEVYRHIVEAHGNRVLAVYIRNVSRDHARRDEILAMARPLLDAGASLLLASDSTAMAEHAADLGLIAPQAVALVRGERAAEAETPEETAPSPPVHHMQGDDAAEDGTVDEALHEGDDAAPPPDIAVEPTTRRQAP